MKKPLTVRDIAEKAGVSLGTVSRVMNNAVNIDPGLKEHTLSVIRESNYMPLRRPRRNSRRNAAEGGRIAVLFCDISFEWSDSYFSRSYAEGIGEICAAYRVRTEFFTLQNFCDDAFLKRLSEFDGLLIKHAFLPGDQRIERINSLTETIPVVGFGTNLASCRYPQVFLDNRSAGALAAEELLRRGHRAVAFINTDPNNAMFCARADGFREAMEHNGYWEPELFFNRKIATVSAPNQDPAPPLLDKTLDHIVNAPKRATAAVVVNDWGCVGLYRACAERGLRIPEDLSVLGFDNQISICASLSPPLSSISNPLADIGKCAALELISRIDAKSRKVASPLNSRLLSGTLIERDSLADITANNKETK